MRVRSIFLNGVFFILCIFFCAFFIGCSAIQTIGVKDDIDRNLPIIETFRALPDVTSIGFEWKTPEDVSKISGYVIYGKDKEGDFVKIAHIQDPLSTHFFVSKLTPQTEYEYAISSVGHDLRVSLRGETLRVKTSFIDPVDFLYASDSYADRIKIFWSPSPNPAVRRYLIQRLDKEDFITIGYVENRMAVEFFDNGLGNNKEYKYRIIAQSYDGANSIPSKVVTGFTRDIPAPVEGIRTTDNKQEAIWVEWDRHKDRDIIGYNVYSSDIENGRYNQVAFVNGLTFIDKLQGNGVVRYYKVTAVDKYKLESKPQDHGAQGRTLAPPEAPIISARISAEGVRLFWNKINDDRVVSYAVYRQSAKGKDPVRFGGINDNTFLDSNMERDKLYSYYATSVDRYGIESRPSNVVSASISSANSALDSNASQGSDIKDQDTKDADLKDSSKTEKLEELIKESKESEDLDKLDKAARTRRE